jgi:hypothetical protein
VNSSGSTDGRDPGCGPQYCFRDRRNGIVVTTTRQEWHSLREAFETALAIPELRPILGEFSPQYGEI